MRYQQLANATLVMCILGTFCAADWPQWRGPQRDGKSTEKGLLPSWPNDGPDRVWLNRDSGLGYSSPSIAGGRLFVMGARDGREELLCLNAETGEEQWAAELGDVLSNGWGDGPRGTPTVDGERVYALSGRGDLICAETQNGNIVWHVRMEDFGGKIPNWGYCESVLVDNEQLVCTPGGDDGTVLALDKATGRKIWQSSEIKDRAQYASLIVAEHSGVRQYVQLTMQHSLGVAADDGRLLWQNAFPGRTAVVPTPIFHDGHVYVTAGYGVGCELLRLDENNRATEVYANREMKNHHGGVVRVGDHLYGYSDRVGWVCQDFFTGEVVWKERRNLSKGCLTYADGLLYLLSEDNGEVVLIDASPEGWQERGRFQLAPQSDQRSQRGKVWTHPVVANGKLYLRDQELLSCYNISASAVGAE